MLCPLEPSWNLILLPCDLFWGKLALTIVSYWPTFLCQSVFKLLFDHSFFMWFLISPVFFFWAFILGHYQEFTSNLQLCSFQNLFIIYPSWKSVQLCFLICMETFPLSLNFPKGPGVMFESYLSAFVYFFWLWKSELILKQKEIPYFCHNAVWVPILL